MARTTWERRGEKSGQDARGQRRVLRRVPRAGRAGRVAACSQTRSSRRSRRIKRGPARFLREPEDGVDDVELERARKSAPALPRAESSAKALIRRPAAKGSNRAEETVGTRGLEPPTSPTPRVRATRLRHVPMECRGGDPIRPPLPAIRRIPRIRLPSPEFHVSPSRMAKMSSRPLRTFWSVSSGVSSASGSTPRLLNRLRAPGIVKPLV